MVGLVDATVCERPFSGIAKYVFSLYGACRTIDPQAAYRFFRTRRLERPPADGIVECGPNWRMLPDRGKVTQLGRRLHFDSCCRRYSPDFVHFPHNGNVITPSTRSKILVTVHDVLPLEIPGYFRRESDLDAYLTRMQRDLSAADLVFTCSQHSREMLVANFRVPREPVVVHYASTLSESDVSEGGVPVPRAPQGYFLYVGGYHPRKGIEKLVEVHSELYTTGRLRKKLVLVGEVRYYSAELRSLIDNATTAGSLVQLGYVSDKELVWLLKNATAMVYPSLYEGFGLPVLEAMHSGCPVMTTTGTALPEVSGDACSTFDPHDKEQFARTLVEMERNESRRVDLIRKGKERAAEFSWLRTARVFLSEIATVTQNRSI